MKIIAATILGLYAATMVAKVNTAMESLLSVSEAYIIRVGKIGNPSEELI
jgi:hypothetical protein